MTPQDVYRVLTARSVRLHPRANLGAVVLKKAGDERRYESVLYWLTVLDGGVEAARDPLEGVLDLAWSPGGDRFYVLQERAGAVTLGVGDWISTASPGTPDAIFSLPSQPERVTWNRASDSLCLSLRYPSADVGESREDSVHLRDVFPFKVEGRGFHDDGVLHLAIVERHADDRWTLRRLSSSTHDHRMPAISPDGRRIAYVRPVPGPGRFRAEECVAILDRETGEDCVLAQVGGPCWFPSWSPDGRSLVWLGHDSRSGIGEATDIGLWLVSADGGPPREVCAGFGRSIEDVTLDDCTQAGGGPHPVLWDDGGRGVYGLVTTGGSTQVWYFPVGDAEQRAPVRVAGGERRIFRFDHARGQLLIAAATPADPCRVDHLRDGEAITVFAPNTHWLGARGLATPERFVFAGAQGEEVEGWLLPPVGRPLMGAPAVLQINRGRFGWTFYLESQILAGAGFAVGFINPHGAYGYGEQFRATPHHDPATREVDDLLRVVDVLVERGVDARRIGISGASYGGFLVNWLSSQTGRRFAAAVSQASYCNRHNLWGTSSIGPTQWTSLGLPWERASFLLARSPISFVDKVSIPMLLIHGEHDTICPLEQAEQWYTALLVNGRQPEWIIFRGEGHDLARNARPGTRITRMTAIVEWFRRHLEG